MCGRYLINTINTRVRIASMSFGYFMEIDVNKNSFLNCSDLTIWNFAWINKMQKYYFCCCEFFHFTTRKQVIHRKCCLRRHSSNGRMGTNVRSFVVSQLKRKTALYGLKRRYFNLFFAWCNFEKIQTFNLLIILLL